MAATSPAFEKKLKRFLFDASAGDVNLLVKLEKNHDVLLHPGFAQKLVDKSKERNRNPQLTQSIMLLYEKIKEERRLEEKRRTAAVATEREVASLKLLRRSRQSTTTSSSNTLDLQESSDEDESQFASSSNILSPEPVQADKLVTVVQNLQTALQQNVFNRLKLVQANEEDAEVLKREMEKHRERTKSLLVEYYTIKLDGQKTAKNRKSARAQLNFVKNGFESKIPPTSPKFSDVYEYVTDNVREVRKLNEKSGATDPGQKNLRSLMIATKIGDERQVRSLLKEDPGMLMRIPAKAVALNVTPLAYARKYRRDAIESVISEHMTRFGSRESH